MKIIPLLPPTLTRPWASDTVALSLCVDRVTAPAVHAASLPAGWRPWNTNLRYDVKGVALDYDSTGCVAEGTALFCGGTGFTVARVDAASGRFRWTPGPGQVGDFVVLARVSDGFDTVTQSFTLRVVADAAANAPAILVDLTPSTPVLPGQTVLATVRSDGWSPIASTTVQVRGAAIGADDWQTVPLDALGRLELAATAPGLVDIRVTVTDVDGFSSTKTQTVRVRDPLDTAAPVLAWGGMFAGSGLDSAPATLSHASLLQAGITDLQLMGWKLEVAPSTGGVIDDSAWTTLASADLDAVQASGLAPLATLDPALLANGVYALRLTAWDLSGRTSEIDTRVVVDSADKRIEGAQATDAVLRLGDHDLALTRALPSASATGDFGNWTLPLLDTHLTTDQDALTPLGAAAPWRQGARVWLQVPASLAAPEAPTRFLSFVLTASDVPLDDAPESPVVTRTSFTTSDGWTLSANDGDESQRPALQRQGQRLYDQVTGLPWAPRGFVLTGPDGTRYSLDAQGRVQRIAFADGQQWLVSDAGVALVGARDPGQRIDFQRDPQGRITLVTGATAAGGAVSFNYGYDAKGRLVLARALYSDGAGTQYGYHDDGSLIEEPVTANLGTAVGWSAGAAVRTDSWSGTLQAGTPVNLSFTVRQSELDSTVKVPGGQGAVIIAVRTTGAAAVSAVGGVILGQARTGAETVTLLRVTEAGLKLVTLSGDGAASAQVSLAGDLDRDGDVDGADSALFDEAAAGADLNGDGVVDALDRETLFANYGWRANQAPVSLVADDTQVLETHTNLASQSDLGAIAEDLEGDPVHWTVTGATHGSARLSPDGRTLTFTPEPGYSGQATVTLVADDGYAASAPITLGVDVSGARLLTIHVDRLAAIATGGVQRLTATGDFEDEKGVRLIGSYLQYSSSDDGVASVDAAGLVEGESDGTAVVTVQAGGIAGFDAVTVSTDPAAPSTDADGMEVNVYPHAVTLPLGVQRQLKVTLPDLTNISAASAGTRYFISDPAIADVTADGLIIPRTAGDAVVTVVYGGRQHDFTLHVEPAATGPSFVSASQGRAIEDEQGDLVMVAPGGIDRDAVVAIHSRAISDVGMQLPGTDIMDTLGAFDLDLGGASAVLPLQLGIKVSGPPDPETGLAKTYDAGTQVFFWRKGQILDPSDGTVHDTWWLVDNGVIGADGVARTSSPPYSGVLGGDGEFVVTTSKVVNNSTGEIRVSGASLNVNAIWAQADAMTMAPSATVALAELAIFASSNAEVFAIGYTLAGSYKLTVPKEALAPDRISLDFPPSPATAEEAPDITHVEYDPGTRQITVAGDSFVPADVAASNYDFKVWLVPRGDQLPEAQPSGAPG